MQSRELGEKLLNLAEAAGATAADVALISNVDLSVSCRLGKQEELERSESSGVGLRVWVGDRQAIISSSDFDDNSLRVLSERAVAMAKAATDDPHSKQATTDILAKNWDDLDLFDGHEPTAKELFTQAQETEEAAIGITGITNSEGADAYAGSYEMTLLTSMGFEGTKRASTHSLSVSVLAGEGDKMERDYDYSTARFAADMKTPEEIGKSAGEKAIARLNPQKVKTCQVPIIFDPRVGRSLLGAFSGAISGSSITRGTSFIKDKMCEKLFADDVRIIDDPLRKRGLSSRAFDSEGVATKELEIIKDGVLQSWLLDVRTASHLGLKTTGHATRGLASPPSPSASNLYMASGELSKAELLKQIGTGLYVTEAFGMGVNTITGDYSQGAGGFWIENGEITYPVSEITIAGHMLEMFASLIPSTDLTFDYGINCPTFAVDNMTIAGS